MLNGGYFDRNSIARNCSLTIILDFAVLELVIELVEMHSAAATAAAGVYVYDDSTQLCKQCKKNTHARRSIGRANLLI